MDNFGGIGFSGVTKTSKKRRSTLNRRPPNESESPQEYDDSVSLSSTPLSDAPTEAQNSSDEIGLLGDNPEAGSSKGVEMKGNNMTEAVIGSHHSGKPGVASSDVIGNENKVKKVKLKVGGVTRTIHTRTNSDGSSVAGTSATSSHSDVNHPPLELNHKESIGFVGEKGGLRGVPWKDFSRIGFSFGKVDIDRPEESVKQASKPGRSYKVKSISKKSTSDEVYDEEEDDEIRYLQKLKTSKIASLYNTVSEDETRGKKLRKISRVMDKNTYDMGIGYYVSSRSDKESKKPKSVGESEEIDYMEEEESASDGEIEPKNSRPRDEISNRESSITTRRRAIQTGRDNSLGLIQFPDGLPPAPPRKQKEQLSEVEQQLKRAEAAQRRRMQNEKAARQSQDEAIRKILGQDSSRKKREDKIKKRQEELAQERNANAATVAPDVVRWVMGPSGTIVTFPNEIGLPSIFEPKACSYPPPREKCAGPSCTNVYKYRDSKSNLPLCSLLCYKAIHEKTQSLTAC
ncbi:hypothetical protein ACJIZ3_000942 [Penstemon smallii]|uniref:INO80 complex subunit B-like conserved region domain-containing protein n=1 Tax=Penstemon smallii TaxID=265156 RepID=A0ABD3U258_9LAMI